MRETDDDRPLPPSPSIHCPPWLAFHRLAPWKCYWETPRDLTIYGTTTMAGPRAKAGDTGALDHVELCLDGSGWIHMDVLAQPGLPGIGRQAPSIWRSQRRRRIHASSCVFLPVRR